MENNTAKHFVLQLGSVITLYLSISFLIVLLFSVINLVVPDAIENYWQIESNSSSVRLGIAMLIVFFPTYLILTRQVNVIRRREDNSSYLGLTKWLMYLSLLIGGGVILGDLVAVILAFLEGELTTRFLLKAGVLFLVVGGAFYYYLQDARGFWLTRENASKSYAYGMTFVVVLSLAAGFFYSETPAQVREMRLDEEQITDLRDIQYQIENYLAMNGTSSLPTTLEGFYSDFPVPTAPENREPYSYESTAKGFKLCATFSANYNMDSEMMYGRPYDSTYPIKNPDNWNYKQGRYCFERVVN
ncbi:MAG TPA: DUF5671 domain-containing protein [Candidatus Paceibacterota bacterium]|nr:DUF5671 domain-containing protein [Candidatus Paceibacterota bacterium]HMO82915.1 DUF5671 domain-containing protein [Candidatus Paceibacterota bacterium]